MSQNLSKCSHYYESALLVILFLLRYHLHLVLVTIDSGYCYAM